MYRTTECVRDCDIFGTPISLFYKQSSSFSTRFGGCCSIIFFCIMVSNILVEAYKLLEGSYYDSVASQDFVALGSQKKDPWTLSTRLATIAGRL